jgi:hypothetical protein
MWNFCEHREPASSHDAITATQSSSKETFTITIILIRTPSELETANRKYFKTILFRIVTIGIKATATIFISTNAHAESQGNRDAFGILSTTGESIWSGCREDMLGS